MPKKICASGNCHRIICGTEKYCEEHKKEHEKFKTENNRKYDIKIRHNRDKKYTDFYHSKLWLAVRRQIIERDNGLCLLCLDNKKIKSAYVVHHIEEIKANYNNKTNKNNLICLCRECHNIVHEEYNKKNKVKIQRQLSKLIRE